MTHLRQVQDCAQFLTTTLEALSDTKEQLDLLLHYMRQNEVGKWKLLSFGEPVELEKLEKRMQTTQKAIGRTIAPGGIITKVKKQLSGMSSQGALRPSTYFYASPTDIPCLCPTKEDMQTSQVSESSSHQTSTQTTGTSSETKSSELHSSDESQNELNISD